MHGETNSENVIPYLRAFLFPVVHWGRFIRTCMRMKTKVDEAMLAISRMRFKDWKSGCIAAHGNLTSASDVAFDKADFLISSRIEIVSLRGGGQSLWA
jgi:hypothetical protein